MKKPLLVHVLRGSHIESQHQVLASVVDHKGQILQSFGDHNFNVFLRSSAKPFQAIPFITTGAAQECQASAQEIALACASHLGHEIHTQAVQGLLNRCHISAQALQNCEHEHLDELPFDCQKNAKDEQKLLQHNCSGKHAAFLVTQKHLGESLQNYLDPKGRLQKMVLQGISDLASVKLEELERSIAPDGCGAPIFQMPIYNLAKLYAQLGAQQGDYGEALKNLYQSMNAHPEFVRGEGDFNTELIRAFSGRLVAKLGYEGVYGVALANGVGIALKVLDGNARALAPALVYILKQLFTSEDSAFQNLAKWQMPQVQNIHKLNVGSILVEPQ